MRTGLRVIVRDGYATTDPIVAEYDDFNALAFSSTMHGGFSSAMLSVYGELGSIWSWLWRENDVGLHFAHVSVLEQEDIIWEGRVMDVGFDPALLLLTVTAAGYWSSLRDQFYTNASVTNGWTAYDLIDDMLTTNCPAIATDRTHMSDPGVSLSGGSLAITRSYPQDVIIDTVPNTSDGTDVWYFAVWEGRVPYYGAVDLSAVTWTCKRESLRPGGRIGQSANELRNKVTPVVGGSAQTAQSDSTTRPSRYPQRDMVLTLPSGIPTGGGSASDLAAAKLVAERKYPRQTASFLIDGRIYSTEDAGARTLAPLWRVRAGDVLRIDDLLPFTAANPALDNLRTFHIVQASYDAITRTLRVTPDRPLNTATAILARQVTTEPTQ